MREQPDAGDYIVELRRLRRGVRHPADICECGDYRREHPDNGPCSLNGLGHNVPDYKCNAFRLSMKAEAVVDAGAKEKE